MCMTIEPLWKSSLGRVRDRFVEAMKTDVRLSCVITYTVIPNHVERKDIPIPEELREWQVIEAGNGLSAEPRQLFDANGVTLVGEMPVLDAVGNPIVFSDGTPISLRLGKSYDYRIYGNYHGCKVDTLVWLKRTYTGVARDAGLCLEGLPNEAKRTLWHDWLDGYTCTNETAVWTQALFELAWLNLPGCPLKADKYAWGDNWRISLAALPQARRMAERNGYFAADVGKIPDPPTQWYSYLDDILAKSVAAVDALLWLAERESTPLAYSLLDRFPATPAGHIAFLEFVRDEVHYATEAKRLRSEREYSNATLESMVRGIKWAEARQRLVALTDLPERTRVDLDVVLQSELRVEALEYLDAELPWRISCARNAYVVGNLAKTSIVVTTAGDLWKAYAGGKRPCFQSTGLSITPGANTPTITCTVDAADAKRTALDRAEALVTTEGGDKAAAMEKLMARVQLQAGMDKASVINMPLTEFVAAAMGYSRPGNSTAQSSPLRLSDLLSEFQAAYEEHGGLQLILVVHERPYDSSPSNWLDADFLSAADLHGPLSNTMIGTARFSAVESDGTMLLIGRGCDDGPTEAFQRLAAKAGAWLAVNRPFDSALTLSPIELWTAFLHLRRRTAWEENRVLGVWRYNPFSASIETIRDLRIELSRLSQEPVNGATPESATSQDSGKIDAPMAAAQPTSQRKKAAPGEALSKIVPALAKWHEYDNGSALRTEPVGVNQLANLAVVASGSVSTFFVRRFGGHHVYKAKCIQEGAGFIVNSLRILLGEISPRDMYGGSPDEIQNDG